MENQNIVLIKLLGNNLKNMWHSNKEKYSQGKKKLYTSFKERPGFENYLNESKELCKAILACQNDVMFIETEILCLNIQETYQNETYKARKISFTEHINDLIGRTTMLYIFYL